MQQKGGGQEAVVHAGNWSCHRRKCVRDCGSKYYSSRSGSTGRSGVEEAGGKEGRGEDDVW